jgi:DNA-binding response OmpR family regulator
LTAPPPDSIWKRFNVLSVLILDDDGDTLECLSDAIGVLGARAFALKSFDQLVSRREEALACRLAILDVNLGLHAASGVDACHWLRREGFTSEIVFLTGHAVDHPLVQRALETPGTKVFRKPITLRGLSELLSRVG